jgi:glycosyltransferase involved in cell wall biosynthesis
MLLPTFHENFGHVIMEAFQNACPVILSDQTPWSELEQNRLGWDIPLNKPADFISAIEKAASMDGETFDEWSLNSFSFAKEFSNNENIVTANRALFT